MPHAAAHALHSQSPTHAFGRFTLRRLLGKSEATMVWLAVDTRSHAETMLAMPRTPPSGKADVAAWMLAVRRSARLDHPNLATVAECGIHEQWPFVAVDRRAGVTLDEWLAQRPHPPVEDLSAWICGALRGLAFAHDAGIAHGDLQLHHILIDDRGQASVMALAVGPGPDETLAASARRGAAESTSALDPLSLRAHRAAAERDVLGCGLLLHGLLVGAPALGQADVAAAIDRMAPRGREFVRLPWSTPQPIAEALRAIVNRSTSAQARLRYRNARTFLGALDGWREAVADEDGGPVALMLDRLRTVGHLPALPGLAARVHRVTRVESQRTDEIARHLLPDMALSFELLRTLNSAQVQGTQVAGNGPVLTLRRVVALVGVDGVRAAANSLRAWPGPLDDGAARALVEAIDRVRLAGHAAQALRPAGYDGEVVYLIAVLQNLGRLLLRYHFADEAAQIDQLMQPEPGAAGEPGSAEQGSLGEAAATFAVLGVDTLAFGIAAARHWGLGDDVLHMIRRLATDAPVRKPDGDADVLRIVASAANEAVDALGLLPTHRVAGALALVAQRYSRTLRLDMKTLHLALQEARDAFRNGDRLPAPKERERTEAAEDGPATKTDPTT
ncbi:MAG: HDOD domain-containing protein [Caldimonas sp.]